MEPPKNQTPDKEANVRSVNRAIAILKAFSIGKPSMSVIEIQEKVNLSRPTVYRLLETLAAHGLVRAYGTPQRFSLDYEVGRLGQTWVAGLDPVVSGLPILEQLHQETKETVALALSRERQHLYVWEMPSPHVMSMSRGIGPMDHLTRGASGKVILAFMNEKDVNSVLLTTPKDIDKKTVLKQLEKIRIDKYYVARGEIFPGALGIAAPYFDRSNCVTGAVVVYGPEVRFSDETITKTIKLVVESAIAISATLGHVASLEGASKSAPRSGTASGTRWPIHSS
jgi:IclR family transcriptional regulator, acetate operon repressor